MKTLGKCPTERKGGLFWLVLISNQIHDEWLTTSFTSRHSCHHHRRILAERERFWRKKKPILNKKRTEKQPSGTNFPSFVAFSSHDKFTIQSTHLIVCLLLFFIVIRIVFSGAVLSVIVGLGMWCGVCSGIWGRGILGLLRLCVAQSVIAIQTNAHRLWALMRQ